MGRAWLRYGCDRGRGRGRHGAGLEPPYRRGVEGGAAQRAGVGLGGGGEDVGGTAALDDPARLQDDDVGADLAHHAQVVGDDDVRDAGLLPQFAQQIEDLGLHGHVEGRGGLVAHQQVGFRGQGAGDADALALSAGELCGPSFECRGRQPYSVEQFGGAAAPFGLVPHARDAQGFGHDLQGGQVRGEGSVGILEDHLDAAPLRPKAPLGQRGEVGAVQHDPPGGGLEQPYDRAGDGRLAAARLADDGE